MLELDNIHKNFNAVKVLKGIHLEVPKDQIVGVIGSSGSGKTTLLRCINVLEKPDQGRLRIGSCALDFNKDESPSKSAIRALRLKTAMVFQHDNLFPHFTALENITEGLIHVKKQEPHLAQEKAKQLLSEVNLNDKTQAYPFQLSGGQKQRVGIARALAMEPELILFDEPTSALDPQLIEEVLQVIKKTAHQGITLLIASHELTFLRDIADRILFMHNGKIAEEGSPKKIFQSPENPELRRFLQIGYKPSSSFDS